MTNVDFVIILVVVVLLSTVLNVLVAGWLCLEMADFLYNKIKKM